MRDCRLQEALDHAMVTVRPIAVDAGVSLTCGDCPDLQVHADPERLSQVVVNILANAVRYSPRGGRVNLTAGRHDGHVQITIDDSGPGVPPAFRDVIFEPFKQIEGSAAHNKGGTGLGLTISQAIVKEHGGYIVVGDAPGGGARFTIGLPAAA
jgi:signal transduction histidine kinase